MDISKLIHVNNPYTNFYHNPFDEDLQGWGGHEEFFKKMIELSRPKLILEVGTWKGKSAIAMGNILEAANDTPSLEGSLADVTFDTKIVCIDTWLGATEMWDKKDDTKRYLSLKLKNGYPQLYYTFLSNVVSANLSDRIVPFPQTSVNAARHLAKNNVKAGLIYIDASHEYEDVKQDLKSYFPLLDKGGIIFGDDYCRYWGGVILAVDEFARLNNLRLYTKQYKNEPDEAPSDYWVLSRGVLPL